MPTSEFLAAVTEVDLALFAARDQRISESWGSQAPRPVSNRTWSSCAVSTWTGRPGCSVRGTVTRESPGSRRPGRGHCEPTEAAAVRGVTQPGVGPLR
ncbi:hypothetical protein ACWDZ6_30095 [Streptomyces sp. NPDC002926]